MNAPSIVHVAAAYAGIGSRRAAQIAQTACRGIERRLSIAATIVTGLIDERADGSVVVGKPPMSKSGYVTAFANPDATPTQPTDASCALVA